MRLAPPPEGDLIATVPKSLLEHDEAAYASLGIATWPAAHSLSELLKDKPFELSSTYIGTGGIAQVPMFVAFSDEVYWLLERNRVDLAPCECEAVEMLAAAGHHIDHVRIARQMPRGWTPACTMDEIRPGLFRGQVEPEKECSLALGFCPPHSTRFGGLLWASWLAVHVGRLALSFPA